MRALNWLIRAAVFFLLLAFALNNQHEVTLKWFLGREWRSPLVFLILTAFAAGCVVGVLGMLPSWMRQRRRAALGHAPAPGDGDSSLMAPQPDVPVLQPPRDGL
jgi:lipopolysaccharide assembly protein A